MLEGKMPHKAEEQEEVLEKAIAGLFLQTASSRLLEDLLKPNLHTSCGASFRTAYVQLRDLLLHWLSG